MPDRSPGDRQYGHLTLLASPVPSPLRGWTPRRVPVLRIVPPCGELEPGQVIADRYAIVRSLGAGSVALVYEARERKLGARVAIKMLRRELAAVPQIAESFLLEAWSVSQLHHPNVVVITDFGRTDEGQPYLVMEFLRGEPLSERIEREGKLPWGRVQPLVLQIGSALRVAHERGIVHGDLRPENVVVRERRGYGPVVKVLDFGITRKSGVALRDGSPDYMAPEQARGEDVDARTDVYAVGVLLFRLLTGRLPFSASHPVERMSQHLYAMPPKPSDEAPDLDPAVDALVLRALAKRPQDRFPSLSALIEAIEAAMPRTETPHGIRLRTESCAPSSPGSASDCSSSSTSTRR